MWIDTKHASRKLQSVLAALVLSFCASSAWADVQCEVPADFWLKARSGQRVLQDPALKPCWEALGADKPLVIEYRADESSSINAAEFKSWLVALGITSQRITLVENKAAVFAIRITVAL